MYIPPSLPESDRLSSSPVQDHSVKLVKLPSKDAILPNHKDPTFEKFNTTPVQAITTETVGDQASTIPTFNLCDFYVESNRDAFIAGIRKACHEVGFFALTHVGIQDGVIDQGFEAGKKWFDLGPEHNDKNYSGETTGFQRGYAKKGTEKANGCKTPDIKEYIHVGPSKSPVTNIWPKEFDAETPLTQLTDELAKLSIPIQEMFMAALDPSANILSKDLLKEMTKDGDHLLRVISYPPKDPNDPKEAVWAAQHTDIDLFTILPRATAEGLEVQNRQGKWIRVIVPENAVVVNVGDMLTNMTNGYFHSSTHRVVASKEQERDKEGRLSAVYFVHPESEARCDPLEHCIKMTTGKRDYPRANRWEMLIERLADMTEATPEMLREYAGSELLRERVQVFKNPSRSAMEFLKAKEVAPQFVLNWLTANLSEA